jgi:uroporphyrinogen decarboxylase
MGGMIERADTQTLRQTPRLIQALNGAPQKQPPVWFMRQAGRYLPEYRALRATAPDFIGFCLDPEKAAEATLQPMRRFLFDAAIVFADILLLPRALGQEVWFAEGEGPRLGPLPSLQALQDNVDQAVERLFPVGETLKRVRAELEPERALIGFAGAPWTVLTYMLEGRSSDRQTSRTRAWAEPALIDDLILVLAGATVAYLAMQVQCGAQALQLFESWAEGLSQSQFRRLVIEPHRLIVRKLRARGVTVPIIGFPRGSGALAKLYAQEAETTAVAMDTSTPLAFGQEIQSLKPIQGALDPLALFAGGALLTKEVERLIEAWGEGPYVFNLGHGILPSTPIAHVEAVLAQIAKRGR